MPVHSRDDQIPTSPDDHGARSPAASSPSSSPGLSVSSVQARPALTPRNTLAADVEWEDEGPAREARFDEDLEEGERGWFDAEQDADDEDEDEEEEDERSVETASLAGSSAPSEPAFDPDSTWPWHTEQTLATRRMSYPRSTSLPPHTASNAASTLPASPPPSLESSVHAENQRKRARFEDDSITSDFIFRRSSVGSSHMRQRSAPPAPSSRRGSRVSLTTLHESGQSSESIEPMTDRDREEMRQMAASVGIFQTVVDELVDVAEEDAEDHEHLQQIADEVRETILEDQDAEMSGQEPESKPSRSHIARASDDSLNDPDIETRSPALDRTATDYDTEPELHRCASRPVARQGSSADDDIDESVAAMADDEHATAHEDSDDEQLRPLRMSYTGALLADDEEPELKSPLLSPVLEEESESSTETVRITKPESPDMEFKRRISDSQAHTSLITEQHGEVKKRRASMSDFCAIKGILKLPSKAGPAGTVVTACSVRPAESARLHTVSERSSLRSRATTPEGQSTHTAHTVRSNSGVLQMLWEEPAVSDSSSAVSRRGSVPIAQTTSTAAGALQRSGASSPMEQVKSRLATWKWARENDPDDDIDGSDMRLPLPLLPINHHRSQSNSHSQTRSHAHSPRHEMPPAPPNTAKTSAAVSEKPSAPHTRPTSEEHSFPMESLIDERDDEQESEDDSEDQPLELRVRATFSPPPRPKRHISDPAAPQDYLSIPSHQHSSHGSRSPSTPPSPCSGGRDAKKHAKAISRQLSNLAAEDAHFKSHRDSLTLMRVRESSGELSLGINQELMRTQDSFVLNRARVRQVGGGTGRERGLSPIVDASPPDKVEYLSLSGKGKGKDKDGQGTESKRGEGKRDKVEDEGGKGGAPLVGKRNHSDEHVNCPIYEVERPRWYEAKFGGKKLGT